MILDFSPPLPPRIELDYHLRLTALKHVLMMNPGILPANKTKTIFKSPG